MYVPNCVSDQKGRRTQVAQSPVPNLVIPKYIHASQGVDEYLKEV